MPGSNYRLKHQKCSLYATIQAYHQEAVWNGRLGHYPIGATKLVCSKSCSPRTSTLEHRPQTNAVEKRRQDQESRLLTSTPLINFHFESGSLEPTRR
jgi:hypothetical protein